MSKWSSSKSSVAWPLNLARPISIECGVWLFLREQPHQVPGSVEHSRLKPRRFPTSLRQRSDMANKLQHEIKQSSPFSSLEEEAILNLARTADRLQNSFRLMLKPHGLTPTQYNALRILRGAVPGGLTCSELGNRLVSEDPDITRLVDRLARHGLVVRHRDKQDRRVIHTEITSAGLEKLKVLDPLVTVSVQNQVKHMGPQRLTLLIDLLEEAREPALSTRS